MVHTFTLSGVFKFNTLLNGWEIYKERPRVNQNLVNINLLSMYEYIFYLMYIWIYMISHLLSKRFYKLILKPWINYMNLRKLNAFRNINVRNIYFLIIFFIKQFFDINFLHFFWVIIWILPIWKLFNINSLLKFQCSK